MYDILLNVKSSYNFLSSTIKTNEYFEFAQEHNFEYLSLIDTNSMYHTLDFYFEAKKRNIKPVIGVELEFSDFNFILISNNNTGYKNILKIFELYNLKKDFETSLELILKSNNISKIVIPKLNNWDKKIDFDNFFIGINKRNSFLIPDKWNEKIIFTERINLLRESDFQYLKVLNSIKENKKLYDNNIVEHCHYLKIDEIKKNVNFDIHKKNLNIILNLIENNIILEQKPNLISFKTPNNLEQKDFLKNICTINLKKLLDNNLIDNTKINLYTERMNHELEIIFKMNFENYFLIVQDFVNFAKEQGIIVGPGRGSASGSLVSYLLNITEIDPIKYDLIFERFLNLDRISMPDIDIDFQDDRRYEVLEYLSRKYSGHFSLISTFQKIGVKNAIREIAKVIEISIEEVDDALKSLEGTIENFSEDLFQKNKKLFLLKEKHKILFDYAEFIVGLPRQSGTHAAGIVISKTPLNDLVPLKSGIDNIIQMEYSANNLEKIGLIKIDILGLRNLSIINQIIEEIKKSRNENIFLNKIYLNDDESFKTLANGKTNSIFQFESQGMVDTLKKIKPKSILDLASTMALYRPGPIDYIPEFVINKNKNNIKTGFGPEVDNILKETYGIIIYQEQIMSIFQSYAGFSLNEADNIRSAISKKNETLMKSFKNIFFNKSLNLNRDKEKTEKLWVHIEKFASYGFNKSHAISYSLISYYMSYLKTHYGAEFYSSVLNFSIKDREKTSTILKEFKNSNGKVNNPNIRFLTSKYRVVNGMIQMPLTSIKGIGSQMVDNFRKTLSQNPEILKDKNNFFGVLLKIYSENLTKEIFSNLVKGGVFDWYGISRKNILTYDNEILNILNTSMQGANINDIYLDIFDERIEDNEIDLENYELEVFGFTVNANLTTLIRKKYGFNTKKISEISFENNSINLIGRVKNITLHKDKNNNEMAFLNFADETGEISITVFSSQYSELKNEIILNNFYLLNVKVQFINENIKAILNKVIEKHLSLS